MEKFIENLKNINNLNNNIQLKIKMLEEEIEDLKGDKEYELAKRLEKKKNKLTEENEYKLNAAKKYLDKIRINKELGFSSLPVKVDDNTKSKFKEIAKKVEIKQGELFGILLKYFVDEYCKRYQDDCK
jgi:L-fucose isomerase-like protein